VKEGPADDDADDDQTGVYDNVDNVQQQLSRHGRRSRRDQYLNHVAAAGAVHDDANGTSNAAVTVVDGGAAASGIEATLTSGDADGCTTSVRRRGRCADRLTSNRVVGPSFVSSALVQLGGNSGCRQQTQQQSQQRFLSSGDAVDSYCTTTSPTMPNNEAASTTSNEDCTETGHQPATEPAWNGYDNVVRLNETMVSSSAAKLAAVWKTQRGVAASTTVPNGGVPATDEGLLSDRVPPTSGRPIGERLVDVHRQRLNAAGRELTTSDHDVQTRTAPTTKPVVESSMLVVVPSAVSPKTDTTPVTSGGTAEKPDQKTNSAGTPVDVGSSHASYTDNAVTNGGSPQKKKTVTFRKEDANCGETKVVAGKVRKQKNKEKPPIGKTGNDASKKAERKSELHKEKKENKSATGSQQQDHVIGKTEQPVSKISFLKSLLTRSRSPSPKRSNNNDRSASPLSLGRDVARRLSDPLKSSFKQPPDAQVVKVSVRQHNEKNSSSEESIDRRTNIDRKAVNSSDVRVEETVTFSSTEEVKSCLTLATNCHSETSASSKTENLSTATNSSDWSAERRETTKTSFGSVPSQSSELVAVATTVSTLPTSHAVSSVSGLVEQSPERRRSATVITLRSATASSGTQSTTNRLSAAQTTAALPCNELRNPWLVNLKEFRMRPDLDSFEGEKVFKKGTATTRLTLPGFARSQQDFLTSGDGEPRSQTVQRSTTTTRRSPAERLERHSAITPPIYDAVYEEHPSTIYKSTTELMRNRCESTIARPANDAGKSSSLQDLKLRAGARQTSTSCGDAPTAGRTRTPTTTEHAIDDDELRNCTGYSVRGRGHCAGAPTPSPKPVKSVTFRDDMDTNCPSAERRLESPGKTETSMGGKVGSDFSVGFSGSTLPLHVSRTHTPVVDHKSADRCVKMTKSSSLPVAARPPIHSGSVDQRSNVSALRDTITSCDLDELPKYLADMYRQQKVERQREQELAARDRERLENIEKMWKEFENRLTSSGNVTNIAKAEPTEDDATDISRRNTHTSHKKSRQQVLMQLVYNINCARVKCLLSAMVIYMYSVAAGRGQKGAFAPGGTVQGAAFGGAKMEF